MERKDEIVLSAKELSKSFQNEVHALTGISFDVYKGEILGVIGRNGAGKSTLLKVLSEITSPSSGYVEYEGKMASIMDIGSGFHPDLTGRENIYLSSSLIGNSKRMTDEMYASILSFSGMEDYADMPVKNYSSGMYLRLAFSVAFHIHIDILLLDEVLAVGDADFKRKCYEKIRELAASGTSIIIVSHSMEAILEFCNRVILLDGGRIYGVGNPIDIVEQYMELVNAMPDGKIGNSNGSAATSITQSVSYLFNFNSFTADHLLINKLTINASGKSDVDPIYMNDQIEITLECSKLGKTDSFEIIYFLLNLNGLRVLTDSPAFRLDYKTVDQQPGLYHVKCFVPANLLNRGIYTLGMIVTKNRNFVKDIGAVARFKVLPLSEGLWDSKISTILRPKLHWEINKMPKNE